MFPNTWKKATSIRAVLKSRKNKATGIKIVEEPKPIAVPINSAINAVAKNNNSLRDYPFNNFIELSYLNVKTNFHKILGNFVNLIFILP